VEGLELETVDAILQATVRAGTPLLYAALGELVTEKSGVLNLGVEGFMLMGAVTGFVTVNIVGLPLLGVVVAALVGFIMGVLYALLTVEFALNQVVTGLAFVLGGSGLSGFLGKAYIGKTISQVPSWTVPVLGNIPILKGFFSQDWLVYLSYLVFFTVWYFVKRTRIGVELSAVGENPRSADSAGINVYRYRFIATAVGGSLMALGGAHISLAYAPMWIENMTAGRGWIALVIVIFAFWDPTRVLLGAYLFGGVSALQYRVQTLNIEISPYILGMFPYLVTIGVMLFFSSEKAKKMLGAPRSLGKPYLREGEK